MIVGVAEFTHRICKITRPQICQQPLPLLNAIQVVDMSRAVKAKQFNRAIRDSLQHT